MVIPPSPEGDGAVIQAQYTIDKNIIHIIKLKIHTIVDDIIGRNIGEEVDFISYLFMTKLVEAELNEGISNEW
jgi:hypothetical protein